MRISASAMSLKVEDVFASSDLLITHPRVKGWICLAGGTWNDR
jgi:hypothetical protein